MYTNALKTIRIRTSTVTDERTSKQQFESDRGRVLFSSPFRRLQSKAQVFSLESNAAVRSRLTHSIEVAHIGRYIAELLVTKAKQNKDEGNIISQYEQFSPLIETACLLHDIGNPPFGHLGENAIQEWFKQNASDSYFAATGTTIYKKNSYYLDFLNFDGNPQGARIAMTLQGAPGKGGLNLTIAQIGAIIKYPQFSTDIDNKDSPFKKISIFTSEKASFTTVWSELSLEKGQRHPLVYLMEASDDIAYCLSDIEDGIEKGIITEDQVLSYLEEKFSTLPEYLKKCIPQPYNPDESPIVSRFVSFRTGMINLLTQYAANKFYDQKDSISKENVSPIFDDDDDPHSQALNIIKKYCRENLYTSQEAEDIEIAGYNIVHGLLDKFSLLMKLTSEEFNELIQGKGKNNLERRMFSKLPSSLIEHYKFSSNKNSKDEWFIRFQLIVDYISGMTDDFALKLYKLFHGIEVNMV
ncbi:MAG: dGTPase [Oceanospirillaceae bacterium]|nr:dGTPase [Oceanospirillaceae bacterium]